MSVVIEARYAGECDACTFGIRPGQKIQAMPDGGWEHTRCPAERQTCPECFTQVSVSGACMCGDAS